MHPPSRAQPLWRIAAATAACLLFPCWRAGAAESAPVSAPSSAPSTASPETVPAPAPASRPVAPASAAKLVLGAYAEILYAYNFNRPSNGITALRGFDNRHNTFTVSNVALDAAWEWESLSGRLTLQVGHTPSTYYLAEPALPGGGGASSSGADVFKYIQQAVVGWRAPIGRGLTFRAGLFVSPIGPEVIPVKDGWNWSRSNLFFGLPFYHTGLTASYDPTATLSLTLMLCNGWNSVTDGNREKSVSVSAALHPSPRWLIQVLYFGGVERPAGAPEGRAWRHLFDAYAQWDASDVLSFLLHADGGFEPNLFGTSAWLAGAAYVRLHPLPWLYLAARGDAFWEKAAANGAGTAASLFWPVPWVASATATIDVRPHEHVSVRLEYRHDQAAGDAYFRGAVAGDGSALDPYVPNAHAQDTLLLGVTAWY